MSDNLIKKINRRSFLKNGIFAASVIAVGGISGYCLNKSKKDAMVWQIDPDLCVQCERCSINCVLTPSAVKCVHAYSMCGYCDLCGGYLKPDASQRDTAAENRLCPTNAIQRKFIEDPFFEYNIDEALCIGCGKCVKGCGMFGNGSLFLQVRHDRCVNCNECAIAKSCPSGAMKRVRASHPYLFRGDVIEAGDKKI
jgi:Na+-translocating ferredoxin:NAD+ oxidoreductase subunit B